MRLFRVLFLSLGLWSSLSPSATQAGAWLEQSQHGFLSTSTRLRPGAQEISGYAAYGVGSKLTFGLDLNSAKTSGHTSAHALVFARLPLRQEAEGWQLATELSLGMMRSGQDWAPMQRLTLSAGRGLTLRQRSGWVAIDLTREFSGLANRNAWKLDTTLGLNAQRGRRAPILQLEAYKADGADLLWKVLPGLRFPLSQDRTLVAGLEWRSFGDNRLGLHLALWHRF